MHGMQILNTTPHRAISLNAVLRTMLLIAPMCMVSQANGEVRETINYSHYTAHVARGQSLMEALNAASPIRQDGRTYHGYTKWLVRWNFRWNENRDRSCSIASVTTSVTSTITLPRIDGGTASQKKEFQRFSAALKEHELGHHNIAKAGAEQVKQAILALPEMTSCKRLERAANDTGNRVVREHNEKDKRYDADTRHGRTQGAWVER